MKSLSRTTRETPKATMLVIATALLGVASIFIESADFLGVPTEIVKWVSFGVSALTFVLNIVKNNH
jgi:hypothetical protein